MRTQKKVLKIPLTAIAVLLMTQRMVILSHQSQNLSTLKHFVEDMRRKSEEIALSIASRFAERMDGIVEPVYPPNETGTNTFFANPRAYSICNGSTKVILFVCPYKKYFQYSIYSGSKLTPYEQSLKDTTEKIYKMDIRWFNLSLKSDGSLSWNEFSDDVIRGSYNYVKNFDFNIYKNCQW